MTLIAGLGVGLWLATSSDVPNGPDEDRWRVMILLWSAYFLGGLALVGPPLLLGERRRWGRRLHWGPGKLLWFSSGTASWLLWPPVIATRVVRKPGGPEGPISEICFLYGTPLMALYVTAALLCGGWLGKRRRRRMARSWRETFGLFLGLAWACTGLYVLEILYETDLYR